MEIRAYLEADEGAVAALWERVFGYGTPHNAPGFVIKRKVEFQRELFFVAVVDVKVVGTVMAGYDGHRGWIYSMAVLPEYRRRGIATALMKHAENALRERGAAKINLQLLASNAATCEFYKGLGYSIEERISMGKVVS
jgi:ribosomal protein S18 acetylase RimI-like enzyme